MTLKYYPAVYLNAASVASAPSPARRGCAPAERGCVNTRAQTQRFLRFGGDAAATANSDFLVSLFSFWRMFQAITGITGKRRCKCRVTFDLCRVRGTSFKASLQRETSLVLRFKQSHFRWSHPTGLWFQCSKQESLLAEVL